MWPAPKAGQFQRFHHWVDGMAMHPAWGLVILGAILFLVFQAVFSWANVPMDAIKSGMADGPLRSLQVDGVIAGAGSVVIFLPQILILFFFTLLLEDCDYLKRAAFLVDNLMGKVACRGMRSFPCCRVLPAPFPASLPPTPLPTGKTTWPPSWRRR